jgi:hypothetical protein
MTVAIPIDAGYLLPSAAPTHGVVYVLAYGVAHYAATCSCGWTGRRRFLKAAANLDAWEHSIHEKSDVSVPLVIPAAAG